MGIVRDTIENLRSTTPTKTGDAVNSDEAVSKGQFDTQQTVLQHVSFQSTGSSYIETTSATTFVDTDLAELPVYQG